MKASLYSQTRNLFLGNKGYASTKELTAAGIHTSHIRALKDEGVILKIKSGLYRWADYEMDQHEELVDVSKMVPNGVLCLLSALSFYELTTYQPWKYYVAVHRDSAKVQLPKYPPIQLMYFSNTPYREGIDHLKINGHEVKIYNPEKTLCDCARYRNKIGIDLVKESFKAYVQRPDKNVEKLMYYADKTRAKSVVLHFVEVLL